MGDLEDLLHLENMFQEYGRIDGYTQGQKEGEAQGKILGIEKGFDFGKEIGFYIGFATVWIQKVQKEPNEYPTRLLSQLEQFLALAQSFQTENNLNEDPLGLMRSLQSRYRAIQSLTKTNVPYNPDKVQLSY